LSMKTRRAKPKQNRREAGVTLLETLVALSILAVVAIAFMGGLSVSAGTVYEADEKATAESLARSQMEWAKNEDYSYNATSYSLAPVMGATDYLNYSANITAAPLYYPDEGIQKITVTVQHFDEIVYTLEGYKVDR
jgi:prepilin-type N-terminal cleavage/methylation domain-containing protein